MASKGGKICIYNNEFYYIPSGESQAIKEEVKWCFELKIKVWGYDDYDGYIASSNTPKGEYVEKNGVYVNEPDLTKFNKAVTHYVTYDTNGNEIISDTIDKAPEPTDWYDYQNSKWANVVTISGDTKAYWVWIPRYVYMLDQEAQTAKQVKIKFVDVNNNYKDYTTKQITNYPDTVPTFDANGYQTNYCLPDAFTWDKGGENETALAGYWVSKYEISDIGNITTEFLYSMTENSITIENVKVTKTTNIGPTSYDIYLNGEYHSNITSTPYTISDLNQNTEYKIKVVAKYNDKVVDEKQEIVKTLEKRLEEIIQPDISQFVDSVTYYLTYAEDGTEIRTPITEAQPSGWYDYKNNKWANIVTSNEGKEAYWVWIPRYEYKPKSAFQQVQIRFITKTQTTPTSTADGWKIPDAFSWDGKPIAGYWVSKYEISDAATQTTQ